MKNKRLNNRKLRYVFYTLLTCVLCVGCTDSPSFVEQIGKDVRNIQQEFEKGCKQPKETWISVDTIIIDTIIIKAIEEGKYKYYRIKIIPPQSGITTIYWGTPPDSLSVGNVH